jgi:hypothetical protein
LQRQPFAGDGFKGIRGRAFLGLPFGARIDAVGKCLPRLVTQRARLLQCDVRIDAQREKFFAASNWYLNRHHDAPFGLTSKYSPPPSLSL